MEESGFFEYWFTVAFVLFFIVWFPSYAIKTKGRGLPLWGLAVSIVLLFLILPLINIAIIQEMISAYWNSNFSAVPDMVKNVTMKAGSIHRSATLDQVYLAVSGLMILVGIVQSMMSAWLLYVRHNRRSLFRAIRFMWCSALMTVLAVGLFPFLFLGAAGSPFALDCAPYEALYIAILLLITAYLRMCPAVAKFYPN